MVVKSGQIANCSENMHGLEPPPKQSCITLGSPSRPPNGTPWDNRHSKPSNHFTISPFQYFLRPIAIPECSVSRMLNFGFHRSVQPDCGWASNWLDFLQRPRPAGMSQFCELGFLFVCCRIWSFPLDCSDFTPFTRFEWVGVWKLRAARWLGYQVCRNRCSVSTDHSYAPHEASQPSHGATSNRSWASSSGSTPKSTEKIFKALSFSWGEVRSSSKCSGLPVSAASPWPRPSSNIPYYLLAPISL